MSELVSVNLSHIPFLNTCDTSRLQMVGKYFGGQSLPHLDNEIPKLVSVDSYRASIYTDGFIKFAKDDGVVVYSNDRLMVVYYKNLNKIETYHIPEYKSLYSLFATKLRFKLPTNKHFNKGDILYEYAGFKNGIPAPGFNARVLYATLQLLDYEDAIIISESFAKKFKFYSRQVIHVPIYINSVLKKNSKDKFLPDVGDVYKLDETIVSVGSYEDQKTVTLFDLLARSSRNSNVDDADYNLELIEATVNDIKVFKINKSKFTDDKLTNQILETEYQKTKDELESFERDIKNYVNDDKLIKKLIKQFYDTERRKSKLYKNLNDVVYVIRVELVAEEPLLAGDKLSTRGANKGVVHILPDEIMPKDETGKPVDVIISPFAIPSRMNVNQIYELDLSYLVDYAEKLLLQGDVNKALDLIDDIAKKFSTSMYKQISALIKQLKTNDKILKKFIDDVKQNGLYLVVDSFKDKKYTKQDILEIYEKYNIPYYTKITYNPNKIKEYLGLPTSKYFNNKEVTIDAKVGIMYIYRLFKIARYMLNARSVGPYHKILKTPTRGRAKQGGSRIGNNEIDMLLSYDSEKVLKEFITIKSDDHNNKIKFLRSTIHDDEFTVSNIKSNSYVQLTINSLIKTLFIDFEEVVKRAKENQKLSSCELVSSNSKDNSNERS